MEKAVRLRPPLCKPAALAAARITCTLAALSCLVSFLRPLAHSPVRAGLGVCSTTWCPY